ncbi:MULTISPECIES: IS30 family transposase, partial [unclassified Corynebacterium]|uniref:IS30 family transposase n=1 Tax=unclassified Corynebacterium TaxID=2624378 RepID=UPI004033A222
IRRNSNLDGSYNPFSAARCAAARRGRPKLNKVYTDTQLWALVAQGLEHNQSPEQITATLRRRFPHRKEWHVCHETIYQALYVYPRGGLKKQVTAALRTGRAVRKPHSGMLRQSRIKNMINIVERPADIENRLLPGDWEGDLIVGEYNKTAIGTLVDRKTRYVMLLHLPGAHDAISVRNAMIERLSGIPEQIRQSVTWDQGSEMAMHEDITTAVGVDIYFCDPHAPWQRGTNENTNGLLRQYFPKSTDLSVHTPEDLLRVEELMNNRPRKVLDWATPAEVMWDELDGILGDD